MAIGLIWLSVLPSLGRLPSLREAIDERDAHGIDASAMYYTDLEMMDGVIRRNEQFHRQHPEALWTIRKSPAASAKR